MATAAHSRSARERSRLYPLHLAPSAWRRSSHSSHALRSLALTGSRSAGEDPRTVPSVSQSRSTPPTPDWEPTCRRRCSPHHDSHTAGGDNGTVRHPIAFLFGVSQRVRHSQLTGGSRESPCKLPERTRAQRRVAGRAPVPIFSAINDESDPAGARAGARASMHPPGVADSGGRDGGPEWRSCVGDRSFPCSYRFAQL